MRYPNVEILSHWIITKIPAPKCRKKVPFCKVPEIRHLTAKKTIVKCFERACGRAFFSILMFVRKTRNLKNCLFFSKSSTSNGDIKSTCFFRLCKGKSRGETLSPGVVEWKCSLKSGARIYSIFPSILEISYLSLSIFPSIFLHTGF